MVCVSGLSAKRSSPGPLKNTSHLILQYVKPVSFFFFLCHLYPHPVSAHTDDFVTSLLHI